MPIVFPTNPSLGDIYDFGGIHYIYNGDGWVNKSIYGVSAGADIQFENYNGTGPVVLTSPTLYGISGSIYASSLATGLLHGGIISINAGNTAQFDITSGRGQIHASGSTYTADPLPILQYVTWPSQTGVTVTNLATSDTTWLYIDNTGTLQQRTEYYTDDQLENAIIIGQLIHPSRTFINLARTNPNVAYATDKQYEQFIRSFGPIKVSGHTISPNGANLKLNRSSGKAFSLGRNWINNTDDPSVVSDNAQTDCIFYRYYRGVTAGSFVTVPNQTAIDPTKYDNGTGVLATVPGGKYTIQRLFYYPNTPTLLGVYYGRALYTSIADAAANINLEDFTEIENTRTNAIFAGYLIVKGGATNLSSTTDALILQSGSFRSTSSGGGSVSLTLDDLTDVIITSPQNYQVLTYVDGVTGWENLSVTALPLVSSFNGHTGAIQGVSAAVAGSGISVSGATGSVTITNTGVLSFNGKTGAIQGVSSINGSTGAITNVAFTNVAQSFSGLQQFTQGISGSGGVTFYFPSGNTSIRFVSTAARYIEINPGSQNVMQGFGSGGFKFKANAGSLELKAPLAVVIGDSDLTNNGTQLYVDDDSGVISFVFSGGQYTFPNTDGSANYVMKTDGAGALSWSPAAFTNIAQTFSALQSFSSGISASGGTFSTQLNAQNFKALTVGGDEGGQIEFGVPATGTTLNTAVAIDIYQNRLRIFETGGSNRGIYADLNIAGTGVGGVIEAPQLAFASNVVSLSGVTTYQSIFTSSADTLTLVANTTYIVEGHLVIESGTTTHTTAVRLTEGVVVNAPTFRLHFLTTGAAAGTPSRAQDTTYFETSGGVLNATSAAARTIILLRGSIETIDSLTITPQVAFSANPGGTNQTAIGSWIKFTPVGSNTMTSVGPWA